MRIEKIQIITSYILGIITCLLFRFLFNNKSTKTSNVKTVKNVLEQTECFTFKDQKKELIDKFLFLTKTEDLNNLSILINSIPQYFQLGMFFIPQKSLLRNILKNGKIPIEKYTVNFFKMGFIKIFNILCTFCCVTNQFNLLNILCNVDFYYIDFNEEIKVTYENICKLHDENCIGNIDEHFIKLSMWLERIYNPLSSTDILNLKFNIKIEKNKFLGNSLLNELNEIILISDGKNVEVSILDYLIISDKYQSIKHLV